MRALAIAAMLLSTQAHALDLTQILNDDEGTPLCSVTLKDADKCPTDKYLTLGRALKTALYSVPPNEIASTSGEEKFRRGELAFALNGVSTVKLKIEDAALLKVLTGKLYTPYVVTLIWKLLEADK